MGAEVAVLGTAASVVGAEAVTGIPSQVYGAVEQRKARKDAKAARDAEANRVATEQAQSEKLALAQRKKQIDTLRRQVLAPQLTGGRRSLITSGRGELGIAGTTLG